MEAAMTAAEQQPDHARAERARAGDVDYSLIGAEHVRRYEETNGEVGYLWNGAPTLVLTTTGRSSGEERKHALIYATHGDDVLIVASRGGGPDHPEWYKNLVAQPNVRVQIRGDRYDAVARTASPEEKAQFWPLVNEVWPSYDDYQKRTTRDIPVVVLTRR
jgi:deazaflavin-dependent oxidoreductase (nitroreductase family)